MSALVASVLGAALALDADVTARIDGARVRTISPYLASMSLAYSWAPDRLYGNATFKNATLIDWAVRHGINTARYPAGQASYWNWEDPSGAMGRSTLNPSFHPSERIPSAEWMSLDEYLDLCEAVGMRPLIGVNYNCHNNAWMPPLNESVARAVRQVRHVLARGHAGALWYIGNEDAATQHAARWAAHAKAMKAVDPTMRVFFNDNDLTPKALVKFLNDVAKVGPGLVDGAEFHGKWPYGGAPPSLGAFSVEDWQDEVPLIDHKHPAMPWRTRIQALREAAAAAGYPDLLVANNEYGLGKPEKAFKPGSFTRYTKALVVVEFALEMYVGGYDVAAFWDNAPHAADVARDHDMLLAPQEDYRFNPCVHGIEMLSGAANHTFLTLATSDRRVHGFAARGAHQGAPALRAFFLNKHSAPKAVAVTGPPRGAALTKAKSMVDTADHWGEVVDTAVVCQGVTCTLTLPPLSFTMMESA